MEYSLITNGISVKKYRDIINSPPWPPTVGTVICASHPGMVYNIIGTVQSISGSNATISLLNGKGTANIKSYYSWNYTNEEVCSRDDPPELTKKVLLAYDMFIKKLSGQSYYLVN